MKKIAEVITLLFVLLFSFDSSSKPINTFNENYTSYVDKTSLFHNLPIAELNRAPIEPTTIISVGMSVAKLFFGMFQGDQGPSIGDYVKNLSDQINIVNQKMDVLVTEIQKLQDQILHLPPIIVTKLKQREIQGSLGQYEAILTNLQQQVYKKSISKYMQDPTNRKAVAKLVADIRKTKSELEGVNDPYVVPFVAVAIHIEYNLRQNFLKEPLATYAGFINQDQKYLVQNCVGKQNSLKTGLAVLTQQWKTLTSQTHHRIIVRIFEKFNDRYFSQYNRILEYYGQSPLYPEPLDSNSLKELNVLKRIGLLMPSVDLVQFKYPDPNGALPLLGNDIPSYLPTDGYDFPDFNVPFDQRKAQAIAKITNMLRDENDQLRQTFYALAATTSAYYTGLNAMEFCNARLRLTGLIK